MRNQTKKKGGGTGRVGKNCPGVDEPPEMQGKLAIRLNVISARCRLDRAGLTMMFGTGEFTGGILALKFLIELGVWKEISGFFYAKLSFQKFEFRF